MITCYITGTFVSRTRQSTIYYREFSNHLLKHDCGPTVPGRIKEDMVIMNFPHPVSKENKNKTRFTEQVGAFFESLYKLLLKTRLFINKR